MTGLSRANECPQAPVTYGYRSSSNLQQKRSTSEPTTRPQVLTMKKAGLSLPLVAPVCHCSGLAVDEIIFQKKALKAVARPLRGPAPPLTIQYLPGGVPLCSFFSGGRLPLRMAPPTLACGGNGHNGGTRSCRKAGGQLGVLHGEPGVRGVEAASSVPRRKWSSGTAAEMEPGHLGPPGCRSACPRGRGRRARGDANVSAPRSSLLAMTEQNRVQKNTLDGR